MQSFRWQLSLVPKSYASTLLRTPFTDEPDYDDVRWASRRLKISQEATVFRLEQVGLYRPGSYDRWKALVHNLNPDYFEKSGGPLGSEPPGQEKVKLAKYGFGFARAFDKLLRETAYAQGTCRACEEARLLRQIRRACPQSNCRFA